MVMDYLITNYEPGEPIFLEDILIEGMSEDVKQRQIERLLAYKELIEFDQDTVYLPKKSILDGKVCEIPPDCVAYERYIFRKGKRIGYYGGYSFANRLGISLQVPMKEELVSNEWKREKEEVLVGDRTFILRCPPVMVDKENYRTLQLLDILSDLDRYMDEEYALVKSQLVTYIQQNHVSRENINKYISFFSVKTYQYIKEMGLDYVFA